MHDFREHCKEAGLAIKIALRFGEEVIRPAGLRSVSKRSFLVFVLSKNVLNSDCDEPKEACRHTLATLVGRTLPETDHGHKGKNNN